MYGDDDYLRLTTYYDLLLTNYLLLVNDSRLTIHDLLLTHCLLQGSFRADGARGTDAAPQLVREEGSKPKPKPKPNPNPNRGRRLGLCCSLQRWPWVGRASREGTYRI